jgi:hypothetical protein
MKKIAALVTTLILGASSAALAAPGFAHNSFGPANRVAAARPFRPAQVWKTLEASGSLTRGRDAIDVSATARFSKLKLEAARGSLYINKIVITFGNGQKQTVKVGKTLTARSGATLIDVDGRTRNIDKVMVMGRGGYRATYSLAAL